MGWILGAVRGAQAAGGESLDMGRAARGATHEESSIRRAWLGRQMQCLYAKSDWEAAPHSPQSDRYLNVHHAERVARGESRARYNARESGEEALRLAEGGTGSVGCAAVSSREVGAARLSNLTSQIFAGAGSSINRYLFPPMGTVKVPNGGSCSQATPQRCTIALSSESKVEN